MPQFIKWDRPRGTVHNVATALELASSEHCNVLLVSDATLYVLQNLIALDVEFKARWADQVFDFGYIPITEESSNYPAWVDLIDQVQSEVVDMSCEVVTALEAINATQTEIRDILSGMSTEQGGWDDLLTDLLLPLSEVATGADILQLSAALRDNQVQCCDALATRPYYPVDPDTASNPETSTFCQRADSWTLDWFDAGMEIFSKAKTIGQVGIGILSLIVAALSLPIAAIVAIVGVIAGGIAELTLQEYENALTAMLDDLRCLIYTAPSAQAASEAVDDYLLSQVDGISSVDMAVLRYLVSQEAMNQIFLETYPIREGATGDCDDCWQGDCNCDAEAWAFGSGSLLADGNVRTIYGEDAGNQSDSRIEVLIGCNRCVEIVAIRNHNKMPGINPDYRGKQYDGDCVLGSIAEVAADLTSTINKTMCVGWIVIDSYNNYQTPVEIDVIVWPGLCVGTGNFDADCEEF